MSRGIGSLYRYSSGLLMHGNVRVLALTGLLTGTYVSMLNTALQPFALSLGLGLTSLGFMQALGNRVGGFSGAIIQPFAGRLADAHGRRQIIIGGSLVSISSMASFLAAAVTHAWPLLIPGFLLLGFSLLSSPASQAILAESVKMEPRKMGIVFSWVFFFNSIPGAVMAFVAGVIADAIGYYLVFALAIALESVNLLLYLTRLKETRESSVRGEARRDDPTFTLRSLIEPPRGLRGFFATFATDAFSFGITGNIIYGMMVRRFGYSGTEIGLVVGTLYLAVVAAQYPATRMLLRFGSKKSLAFSESLGGTRRRAPGPGRRLRPLFRQPHRLTASAGGRSALGRARASAGRGGLGDPGQGTRRQARGLSRTHRVPRTHLGRLPLRYARLSSTRNTEPRRNRHRALDDHEASPR